MTQSALNQYMDTLGMRLRVFESHQLNHTLEGRIWAVATELDTAIQDAGRNDARVAILANRAYEPVEYKTGEIALSQFSHKEEIMPEINSIQVLLHYLSLLKEICAVTTAIIPDLDSVGCLVDQLEQYDAELQDPSRPVPEVVTVHQFAQNDTMYEYDGANCNKKAGTKLPSRGASRHSVLGEKIRCGSNRTLARAMSSGPRMQERPLSIFDAITQSEKMQENRRAPVTHELVWKNDQQDFLKATRSGCDSNLKRSLAKDYDYLDA